MSTDLLKFLADAINPILLIAYIFRVWTTVNPLKLKLTILKRFTEVLLLTYFLAHINRWMHLWKAHEFFPSGHMTFYLTVATAYFQLDRRTALISIPLAILYGELIVFLHFHIWLDIGGSLLLAVPLTLIFNRNQQ